MTPIVGGITDIMLSYVKYITPVRALPTPAKTINSWIGLGMVSSNYVLQFTKFVILYFKTKMTPNVTLRIFSPNDDF